MIINRSKLILYFSILCILAGAFVALVYKHYEHSDAEYSRDHIYIDSQQRVGHNDVKVLFVDEEDENAGGAFLPAYSSFSSSDLCCDGDVFIKIGDRMEPGRFPLNDFTAGQSAYVEILDKNKNVSDAFSLTFYKSDQVPTVFLSSESGTTDYIHDDKYNIEAGTLSIVDSSGELVYGGTVEISGRGNSTWTPRRKPYNIVLEKSASLLGMSSGKNWCLLSNMTDDTFLSNVLAYDMAKSCGMAYAPDARFADLYLNGEYRGLYLLTEDIVVGKGRVDIPSLSEENKVSNPGVIFAESEVHESDDMRWVDMPNNPKDITGGYFIERDRRTSRTYKLEERKTPPGWFMTSYDTPIRIKDPAFASKEEVEYIKSYVQEMEDAIRNKDGINPNTNKKYTEYIDVESWVKWYMVAEIIVDQDKCDTNVYMYKYPDSIDSRIFAGPVWDFDGRWYYDPESLIKLEAGGWIPNLYDREEFHQQILADWKNEFSPYLKNEAPKLIDEYEEYLTKAVDMDVARWNGHFDSKTYVTDEGYVHEEGFNNEYDFHSSLQRLKSWIVLREAYLSECW